MRVLHVWNIRVLVNCVCVDLLVIHLAGQTDLICKLLRLSALLAIEPGPGPA